MRIKTASGAEAPALPDNAYCTLNGQNPAALTKCPLRYFDDDGAYCVPELCEFFRYGSRLKNPWEVKRSYEGGDATFTVCRKVRDDKPMTFANTEFAPSPFVFDSRADALERAAELNKEEAHA